MTCTTNGYEWIWNGVLSIWYNDIIYFFPFCDWFLILVTPTKSRSLIVFGWVKWPFRQSETPRCFPWGIQVVPKAAMVNAGWDAEDPRGKWLWENLWYLPMGNVDLRLGNLWESMENVEGNNLYVQIPCKRVLIEPPFSESCWTQKPGHSCHGGGNSICF